MAKRFVKSMLKVGEVIHHAGGTTTATRERIANFANEFKRLRTAGYGVPSRYEHGDKLQDMIPLSGGDLKKQLDGRHAVGELVDIKLSKDGQQADFTVEISDDRAADQCESNRVKASPIIATAWKDGHGNQYRDFISHFDLVERPADYTQGP